MVEEKKRKTKAQSDQLSDSDTPDEEADPRLRTSEEERSYGTIRDQHRLHRWPYHTPEFRLTQP